MRKIITGGALVVGVVLGVFASSLTLQPATAFAEDKETCGSQSAKTCSSGTCKDSGKTCQLVTSSGNFNYCMCKK